MNKKNRILILLVAIVTLFSFNCKVLADDCTARCEESCSQLIDTPGYSPCLSNCTTGCSVSGDTNNVQCGNLPPINKKIPELTSYIVTVIQVVVPVILIIMGMVDLVKGVTSQKEDEIKKGQKTLVKRLIIGVLIFFITAIVKLLVNVVSDDTAEGTKDIIECVDCFINNEC